MSASVETELLAEAIRAVVSMIPTRVITQIYGNVLMEARDDTISVTATSLAGWHTAALPAKVTEPFAGAVDSRIANLTGALPQGGECKLAPKDGAVILQCGRSRYSLDSLPAEDFPPPDVDGVVLDIADDEQRLAFKQAAAAASDEGAGHYHYGSHLRVIDNRLIAASTNGHKLIETSVAASGSGDLLARGLIVPIEACEIIAKMDGATIRANAHLIEARTPNRAIVHRLIDGTFPDYRRRVPAPSNTRVEVDAADLLGALGRIKILLNRERDAVKTVKLEWDDDTLQLSIPKRTYAAHDAIPAAIGDSGQTIGQLGYLVDIIKALESERVIIDAADRGWFIRLTAPDNDALLGLVQPCRF